MKVTEPDYVVPLTEPDAEGIAPERRRIVQERRLRALVDRRVQVDAVGPQARGGVAAELIGAQRGVQLDRRAEPGQLHRGHAAPAARVGEDLARDGDLAAPGDALHQRELDPLDVPDDGDARGAHSTGIQICSKLRYSRGARLSAAR